MNIEWKRLCPKCKMELYYNHKTNLLAAVRKNSMCRSCRIISDETREKHRQAKLGVSLSKEHRQVLKNSWIGKHHSDDTKQKMKIIHENVNEETREKLRHKRIGQKASEETKEKLRNIRLEIVKQMGGFPSFNRKACEFIDSIQSKLGLQFRHALNGGEVFICGYSVDGYDKDKNIVFEYDESRHENLTRKIKDMRRTERMINKTGCEIIRYSERFKKLYKSYSTYSMII